MNKLYTYLFLLMAFLSPVGALADKGWIDLTNERIINPDFTNNKTNGWTISYRQGTNNTRCEAMEFWNSTFNISQNLMNMPAGRYRMSVQSYFRCKDNNNGYQDYLSGWVVSARVSVPTRNGSVRLPRVPSPSPRRSSLRSR